ncbi:flagellar hook assembly protein FlgD [Methylobacterium sp. Leaf85]|uniref:flagellar hook assembly protein FlgD n=1 Tax=Methylobacterium sp. Leaf85 TaxID=1736241 RepID=UPI0006F48667|nr:flagellar hook assembly protein FlgD [Methylobacterium sp. Leaf85]KQO51581.1 flagellar basal body rod modification protein [Methylobacterium sp. Leaf85]
MTVTTVTGPTATSQTTTTAAATKTATGLAGSLNADTFLTLLMTQLKNQDPTKPMDSTAYVSELATFSQVEQATKTNTKLDSLLSSSFLSQADDIIGRTVTSSDGTVTGKVQSVRITNEGALARLTTGQDVLLMQGISLSE